MKTIFSGREEDEEEETGEVTGPEEAEDLGADFEEAQVIEFPEYISLFQIADSSICL